MTPELPGAGLRRANLLRTAHRPNGAVHDTHTDGSSREYCGDGGGGGGEEAQYAVGQWRRYAGLLAGQLTDAGCLTTHRWRRAVAATPRHLLVSLDTPPGMLTHRQMSALYTDPSLLDAAPPRWWAPPQPGGLIQAPPCVLAGMLELLPHRERMRVLIVSAGAGAYLPALACSELGGSGVVVAELDPACADTIRRALHVAGYAPEVIEEIPGPASADHGPYDAVLLAEFSAHYPGALTRTLLANQLTPGGRMILAPAQHEHIGRGLEVHDRHEAGSWISWHPVGQGLMVDPVADSAAVDYLTFHPEVLDELLTAHVPDSGGLCAGCRALDIVTSAPCHLRTLADTARARHDADTTAPGAPGARTSPGPGDGTGRAAGEGGPDDGPPGPGDVA